MKKVWLLFIALITIHSYSYAQLFSENFDYPQSELLTSHGWTNHSGTGTFIVVNNFGLMYTGYTNSGIGNSVTLNGGSGSREDVNVGFTEQNTNGATIYYSFLINVSSSSSSTDYLIHIGDRTSPTSFSAFSARVFIQDNSGNLRFGLSNTSTATMGTTNFSFNTTYLVIVKYTINTSGADPCSLWVFSSGVPSTEVEAGPPEIINSSTSGQDVIDAIALRQGSITHVATFDGIRIATTWSQAPLPVELTSFTASVVNNSVMLNWRTETEVDNYGFQVERGQKSDVGGQSTWEKIGFVNGSGNSNAPVSYTFTDENVQSGKYSYRLKQIDTDGDYEYSDVIEVDLGLPNEFELAQNFPNPFNPVTKIKFTIPSVIASETKQSLIILTVYDILGNEVATLVNEYKPAGSYEVEFSGSNLASGMYFYQLKTDNFTKIKKMILTK